MRLILSLSFAFLVLLSLAACDAAPPESSSPPASPTAQTSAPSALVASIQQDLSDDTGIPVAEIDLQESEAVTWSDACLGVEEPDVVCAQVITPGYRITLRTPEGLYTFHTNETGDVVRLAETPPESGLPDGLPEAE